MKEQFGQQLIKLEVNLAKNKTNWDLNKTTALVIGFTFLLVIFASIASFERGITGAAISTGTSNVEGNFSQVWFNESGKAEISYGSSVASAGDVNGDGYGDVIVGALWYDGGETDEGAAFVYLGNATGVENTAVWFKESDQADAEYGISVAGAGDVNGDGYSDIIVGSDGYDNGQLNEGGAFVYLGNSSGVENTAVWFGESNVAGAQYGISVASAGDVNNDTYDDIIVGAHRYTDGQSNEGAAFVYLGNATGVENTAVWTIESNVGAAQYGYSVASAGDVNGDGYGDVIVGASQYANGQSQEGKVYIYLGNATGVENTAFWAVESNVASTAFGISVASAGDVNNDSYYDIIIGAHLYDNGENNEGGAFVYLGNSTGINTTATWIGESNQATAGYGISVAGIGDANGDGYDDVIVGAYNYDNPENAEGGVWTYLGNSTGVENTAVWFGESNVAGAQYGYSVASAGDVNNDSYYDIIVGAWFYENGEVEEGAAFVYSFNWTDTQAPQLNANISPSSASQGSIVNLTANVTDNVAISVVLIEINSTNITSINTGSIYFNDSFDTTLLLGNYTVIFFANDSSGSENRTNATLEILDTQQPTINNIALSVNSITKGVNINITSNVTDNVAVDIVLFEVGNTNISTTKSGDIYFNDSYTLNLIAGSYLITVFANDTSGNLNGSGVKTATLTVNAVAEAPDASAGGGGGGGSTNQPAAEPLFSPSVSGPIGSNGITTTVIYSPRENSIVAVPEPNSAIKEINFELNPGVALPEDVSVRTSLRQLNPDTIKYSISEGATILNTSKSKTKLYNIISIETNLDKSMVKTSTAQFKIAKVWADNQTINLNDIAVLHNYLDAKACNIIGEDENYIYCASEVLLLGSYAVFGKSVDLTPLDYTSAYYYILIILFALIALILASTTTFSTHIKLNTFGKSNASIKFIAKNNSKYFKKTYRNITILHKLLPATRITAVHVYKSRNLVKLAKVFVEDKRVLRIMQRSATKNTVFEAPGETYIYLKNIDLAPGEAVSLVLRVHGNYQNMKWPKIKGHLRLMDTLKEILKHLYA